MKINNELFIKSNSIPYDEFINFALYDKNFGYYSNSKEKLGKNGDFYTSVHIHTVFAKKIGEYFSNLIRTNNLNPIIVEVGSGDGSFAKTILENNPNLKYISIEKSNYHYQVQLEKLSKFSNFEIYKCFEEFKNKYKKFSGIIFSNELFDALPVKVVKRQGDTIYEVYVSDENGKLVEELNPITNIVNDYINTYKLEVLDGYRTEIRLNDIDVLQGFAESLDRGYIVTIDYGYKNTDLLHPSRKNGSLRGFYKHNLVEDVLSNVGKMDITSHVNWDVLIDAGYKNNLDVVSFCRQNEFLLSIGLLDELVNHTAMDPFSEESKLNRAIKSLILHTGISQAFDVLIQKK
jgi:SAM-dependent MidA family methyltransferase